MDYRRRLYVFSFNFQTFIADFVDSLAEFYSYGYCYMGSGPVGYYAQDYILGEMNPGISRDVLHYWPVIHIFYDLIEFIDPMPIDSFAGLDTLGIRVEDIVNIDLGSISIPCDSIPPFLMLGRFFTNTEDHGRMGLIFGDQYYFYPDFEIGHTFDTYEPRYDKFESYHDIDHDGIDEVYGFYGDTIVFYHMFEGDGIETEPTKPSKLAIDVSPNPFNSSVRISSAQAFDEIAIFDIAGNCVFGMQAGEVNEIFWKPDSKVATGIYLIRIRTAKNVGFRRVVYMK